MDGFKHCQAESRRLHLIKRSRQNPVCFLYGLFSLTERYQMVDRRKETETDDIKNSNV